MKKQVIHILQITPEAYELLVISLYHEWCAQKSNSKKTLQKLLSCVPLFNWWYKQLDHFEKQFIEEATPFKGAISPQVAQDFYRETISGIYSIFSKPLIKKAYDA
ncbi:hypothetical protein [Pseudotamlana carrageenivorans]|uniref:Uncharacterized protein n=1 Tax=Pseudotamlana carrageenivorans TaxID=2069432 RepID=A0A2I7SF53_9FLAO|nr:hypothetical protein [Tamlana carrageenivorans]AUS04515.1 hypothetical protein C1A40_03065 [Tamlana carrageenivorans]